VALIFILYRKEEVNLFSTVSSNNPVSADELLKLERWLFELKGYGA